jgi:hypothetical protein
MPFFKKKIDVKSVGSAEMKSTLVFLKERRDSLESEVKELRVTLKEKETRLTNLIRVYNNLSLLDMEIKAKLAKISERDIIKERDRIRERQARLHEAGITEGL